MFVLLFIAVRQLPVIETRMWANAQLDNRRVKQFRRRQCLHWIAWPWKPNPRIKHRVASCHTAEVILIGRFACRTPCPKGPTYISRGWWDPIMSGMDVLA